MSGPQTYHEYKKLVETAFERFTLAGKQTSFARTLLQLMAQSQWEQHPVESIDSAATLATLYNAISTYETALINAMADRFIWSNNPSELVIARDHFLVAIERFRAALPEGLNGDIPARATMFKEVNTLLRRVTGEDLPELNETVLATPRHVIETPVNASITYLANTGRLESRACSAYDALMDTVLPDANKSMEHLFNRPRLYVELSAPLNKNDWSSAAPISGAYYTREMTDMCTSIAAASLITGRIITDDIADCFDRLASRLDAAHEALPAADIPSASFRANRELILNAMLEGAIKRPLLEGVIRRSLDMRLRPSIDPVGSIRQ